MPTTPTDLESLDASLRGARLLGLELDVEYRVLAATVEGLDGHRSPGLAPAPDEDRRRQVVWFPVGEVRAILRRVVDGRGRVEQFGPDQLLAVVERLGTPTLGGPLFDGPAPPPQAWQPEPSFEGRSQAADGWAHRLTLALDGDDREHLLVTATFDDVELRRPDGVVVGPGTAASGPAAERA